jgi:20S proteasome alpha/beta subunit
VRFLYILSYDLYEKKTEFFFKRYHDPSASVEEGLATLKRCIDEVAKRLVVSPGKYKVKIVDKDGTREVEL